MPQVVGVCSQLSPADPGTSADGRSFPHRKGVEGLIEALNGEIARLRESGELAEILEAYGIDGKAAEEGGTEEGVHLPRHERDRSASSAPVFADPRKERTA